MGAARQEHGRKYRVERLPVSDRPVVPAIHGFPGSSSNRGPHPAVPYVRGVYHFAGPTGEGVKSTSVVSPSASYSFTVRLQIANRPGMLGRVASAIGDSGGDIGAVDLVETTRERTERDITVKARDSVHAQQIVSRLRRVSGIRVGPISDRTFLMHLGGKIEIRNKVAVRTRDDRSIAYNPRVSRERCA